VTSPLYSFEKRLFQGRRFRLTGNRPASLDAQTGIDAAPLYASVALDVQIRDLKDRLFTYRVPDHFKDDAFVGAQVLVPFGAQGLVAGYVVSLTYTPEIYREGSVNFKDISDILVPEPAFDANYVGLLHWIADFYLCNISDVIQAAIPSIAAPKTKRVIALNEAAFAIVPFEMQPYYKGRSLKF
jgi:primosomal protein N'